MRTLLDPWSLSNKNTICNSLCQTYEGNFSTTRSMHIPKIKIIFTEQWRTG